MAGIYIHIPFCKQACTYCDFYFTTHQQGKTQLLNAIVDEIDQRWAEFSFDTIETIYFGGGTPSMLTVQEINLLIEALAQKSSISNNAEITLESNPDNLTKEYLQDLISHTRISRLCIGFQSFHESELKIMNRAHHVNQSIDSYYLARELGFNSISIDLIYGVPGSTLDSWKYNVEKAIQLNPEHISAYCLTLEENTKMKYWVEKGRLTYPDDNLILEQSSLLMEMLKKAGYDHYEISNFAKDNEYAKHNTNYWRGIPYMGLGPSAHSFIDNKRMWNLSNSKKYIDLISRKKPAFDLENLSQIDQYNEFILTSLRTKWGIDLPELEHRFGSVYLNDFNGLLLKLDSSLIRQNEKAIKLSQKGKHQADGIAAHLFFTSQ